jgi:glycosyltransferase involved in cell wall biosynthesis
MSKIAISFTGWFQFDNWQVSAGGAERELVYLGMLLADDNDVTFYGRTESEWYHNGLCVKPSEEICDSFDIFISNNTCPNSSAKYCYYTWTDFVTISALPDLIITDTKRGKALYEIQGHKSIVLYPPIKPAGFDSNRDMQKVLFVGRHTPDKGLDIAIEAANLMPDKKLHVIGNSCLDSSKVPGMNVVSEVYYKHCRELSAENIIWRGNLEYDVVLSEMRSANMIIIPYQTSNEYNTNVALEAIANGCVPVIAYGLTDYLTPDNAVILPDARNLKPEFVAMIISNIHDTERYREAGWRTAKEIYDYCNNELKETICG